MAQINASILTHLFPPSLALSLSVMEQELELTSLEFFPTAGPLSVLDNQTEEYQPLFLRPDLVIGVTTIVNKNWQLQDVNFFAEQIIATKDKGCLIDVGANIGLFTRQLLGVVKDKIAKAYCYEPDPVNFKLLKKNLAFSSCVTFKEVGLSNKNGKTKLFKDHENCGNYSVYTEAVPFQKEIANEITLVSVASQKIKWLETDLPLFYKSDTQGHDMVIAIALGFEFWKNVECAILEIFPIAQVDFDCELFASILDNFQYKAFSETPQRIVQSKEVIEYLKDNKNFGVSKDLFLWRSN